MCGSTWNGSEVIILNELFTSAKKNRRKKKKSYMCYVTSRLNWKYNRDKNTKGSFPLKDYVRRLLAFVVNDSKW